MSAVGGLAAAVLLALGARDLTTNDPSRAVALFALAVALRGVLSTLGSAVTSRQERQLRQRWHERAARVLATSTPDELHSLDVAVDQISTQPSLDLVQSAAFCSLLGLLLIGYYGGLWSLVVVIGLLALSVPAYVRVGRQSVALMQEFHRRRGALVGRQLTLLRSITDLRALGAVGFGADAIAAESRAEANAVLQGVRVTIRSTLVTEFLAGVSVGLVAMVVGLRLWQHDIQLFPALAAVLITVEMFGWLRRFGSQFHRRDDAVAARHRLEAWPKTGEGPRGDQLLTVVNLRTDAPNRELSFSLTPGQRVRVCGPSGVGKSSLIDTALGLRVPVSGIAEYAGRIGLIRTSSHFLEGTWRENLSVTRPTSDDEISGVLHELGIDAASVLNATLSEDARTLSTGERVVLAVARALLVPVDLLVLDDVSGALDPVTLQHLRVALRARREIAVLEATHEFGVLEHVDQEIRLEFA